MRVLLAGWIVAAGGLAGCESGIPGTTVTLTLSSGTADVVAFRNVGDETWQIGRQVSTISYKLRVNGPYQVTVACRARLSDPTTDAIYRSVSQLGRTLDDGLELSEAFCPTLDKPTLYTVTGTMTQPGSLVMTSVVGQDTPNWSFQQDVPAGTYSLYAVADGRVVARRGLAVDGNVALPNIDVDVEGTALTGVAFSIANPRPGALFTQSASVGIHDASLVNPVTKLPIDQPLEVYGGAPASAQVIPTASLAGHDLQTVTLREETSETTSRGPHTTARTARRAYKVGDDAAFTLPEAIGTLTWMVGGGPVSVGWTSLPANTPFRFEVNGQDAAGAPRNYSIDVTPSYLATLGEQRATLDVSSLSTLPASASIDLTKPYTLDTIGIVAGDSVATAPVLTVEDHVTVGADVGQP